MPNTENILSVRNLNISISSAGGNLRIIKDAEFNLKRGTTVGIIGESGSGKSILSKALLRLLPDNSVITGNIYFSPDKDNTFDILELSDEELRSIRGKKIGFLSQEPSSSMNPVRKCGKQIYDALPDSLRANVRGGKSRVLELLELTGLNEPASVSDSYPHELSGGMLQRVALAAALAGEPDILIADEPTTALDASSRVGIMKTIAKLKSEFLGTESEVSNTWLWAWANKDWGLSPPLMACAEKLRQRGESEGIEEFVTPKFSLDPVDGHQVATVASALCEANCYYRGPYEKGAVFLLIKDPAFEKPSEDPALTITTVFTQVIGAFNVDHRKAFLGYLSYHGIDAQESDSKVTGKSVHGTEVVAQFDASGRLQDLSANLIT